ncbi:unnamed protein product, partial [Effrenium voratum]
AQGTPPETGAGRSQWSGASGPATRAELAADSSPKRTREVARSARRSALGGEAAGGAASGAETVAPARFAEHALARKAEKQHAGNQEPKSPSAGESNGVVASILNGRSDSGAVQPEWLLKFGRVDRGTGHVAVSLGEVAAER